MEREFTHTKAPDGSVVYVFGSILRTDKAVDLDILIVYDPEICLPAKAYTLHKAFLADVAATFGLPVHATLLSVEEERACDFIRDTGAIRFSTFVKLQQNSL
jgi:predicted nucleotidyltransferase